MKKLLYIIALLVFFCFSFWSCEKRPFAHIEIKGRVLHFWNKSPIPSQIQLWVGDGLPGEKGTTSYGNYSTNADGSFDVKSNAEWNGDDYRLEIIPANSSGDEFDEKYTVNRNKTLDIGDILVGNVTITCKVTLNSVSGDSIKFLGIGATPQTAFAAGTHTVITASSFYDNYAIKNIGNFYPITYHLSPSNKDSTIMVPLHPPTDTTSVTINY